MERVKRTRIDIVTVKQVKERGGLYNVPDKVQSPQDAHDIIQTVLDLNSEASEKFGIIALDSKNKVNGIHILSIGSLNASIVHPREVFKQAMLNNSASIVCFHNHPSGDPAPSPEDIELTKRIAQVGEIIGIEVLDHIIIGDNGRFSSMKQLGRL